MVRSIGIKKYSIYGLYRLGDSKTWNTDREKPKKGQKSNFNPKRTKTRGNTCHSFVENKTRDAKRQKAIVKGKVL